jgi:hypothetical protein
VRQLRIRHLLSEEDFDLWWEEWKTAPIDEFNALFDDVTDHYGVSAGKPRR